MLVTVTEDQRRNAKAFVTRPGPSDIDPVLSALRRPAPYLRHVVAKGMRLRVVPELSFQSDTRPDCAMQVDRLLHRPDVASDLTGKSRAVAGGGY
jgi:ribosome-binding factor A